MVEIPVVTARKIVGKIACELFVTAGDNAGCFDYKKQNLCGTGRQGGGSGFVKRKGGCGGLQGRKQGSRCAEKGGLSGAGRLMYRGRERVVGKEGAAVFVKGWVDGGCFYIRNTQKGEKWLS